MSLSNVPKSDRAAIPIPAAPAFANERVSNQTSQLSASVVLDQIQYIQLYLRIVESI
jgi:hypothetical protein